MWHSGASNNFTRLGITLLLLGVLGSEGGSILIMLTIRQSSLIEVISHVYTHSKKIIIHRLCKIVSNSEAKTG